MITYLDDVFDENNTQMQFESMFSRFQDDGFGNPVDTMIGTYHDSINHVIGILHNQKLYE